MTRRLLTAAVLSVACVTAAHAAAPTGRYVEARTASVFAGACHYNGERVTDGKAAVMAWSIERGDFNGVDLAGVRVMASVASDQNLADDAARQAELTVDAPTDAAATAAVAWVKTQAKANLGTSPTIHRGPVTFSAASDGELVASAGVGKLDVRPMPDAACCSQPHLVWYTPLAPITGRRVGYTVASESAGRVGEPWQRSDENSAFYGRFGDEPAVVASR